jgi:hypothetical protein
MLPKLLARNVNDSYERCTFARAATKVIYPKSLTTFDGSFCCTCYTQ